MRPHFGTAFWLGSQLINLRFLRIDKRLCDYSQWRSVMGFVRHHASRKKPLITSSLVLQDGSSLVEMPCMVQVVNGAFKLLSVNTPESEDSFTGLGLARILDREADKRVVDSREDADMLWKLSSCKNLQDVYRCLSHLTEKSVTPSIALRAMELIFELEAEDTSVPGDKFSFIRSALLKQLVETICACESPAFILEALHALCSDCYQPYNDSPTSYEKMLFSECIILAVERKMSVRQICQMIRDFFALGDTAAGYIDSAWVGIPKQTLNVEDLVEITSILEYVDASHAYLYNIFLNQFLSLLPTLQPNHICKIVQSFIAKGPPDSQVFEYLSLWLKAHFHELTETCLTEILILFDTYKYTDECVQRVIKDFVSNRCIQNPSLLISLTKYLVTMRIRDTTILQVVATYFLMRPRSTLKMNVFHLTKCFSYLNFIPRHPKGFTAAWESLINRKAKDLKLSESVELFIHSIFLGCYSQEELSQFEVLTARFPAVFSDRTEKLRLDNINEVIENLLILDAILRTDFGHDGVDLPEDFEDLISVRRDHKIEYCASKIKPLFQDLAPKLDVQEFELLPLSPIRFFEMDFVISRGRSKSTKDTDQLALLIDLPEDFDITGKVLLGPQTHKRKFLEKFGYKVVGLNYAVMSELFNYPDKLREYLMSELKVWLNSSPS